MVSDHTQYDVRPATDDELPAVAELLGNAFLDDPVSLWVFPDDEDRNARHAAFFSAFVNWAHQHGTVMVTSDLSGVALWLPATSTGKPDGDAIVEACGPNWERMRQLVPLMDEVHPEAHDYIAFVGVRPELRGQGIGTTLVNELHARSDAAGTPTYLEASSDANLRLYERLGYLPTGKTVRVGDGAPLRPMVRQPA
jgi:ribosomal protein S18 acetylase RimI-like enzyme